MSHRSSNPAGLVLSLIFGHAAHRLSHVRVTPAQKQAWRDFGVAKFCFLVGGMVTLCAAVGHHNAAPSWHPNAQCAALWADETVQVDAARNLQGDQHAHTDAVRRVGEAMARSKAAGC